MEDTGDTGRRADWEDEAATEATWRHRLKPDNEIPTSLAVDAVLGSTDDVVIFVSGMSVYRNGVDFRVEVRARPGRLFADRVITDPGGSGLFEAMYWRDDGDRGNRLLLGVEFADGRYCANVESREPHEGAALPERPQLWQGDGGGDNQSASASWFLTPLPPPGSLRFICAWTAGGVPETVTTLSADDILSAARRARELWPWEPETPANALPQTPIPAGGWFAARS